MLVLTRAIEEKLVIGNKGEVILTVVEIQGNKVRLGIEAPHDIAIHRQEVFNKLQTTRKQKAMEEA